MCLAIRLSFSHINTMNTLSLRKLARISKIQTRGYSTKKPTKPTKTSEELLRHSKDTITQEEVKALGLGIGIVLGSILGKPTNHVKIEKGTPMTHYEYKFTFTDRE
jgi:hypothetical protein